MKSWIRRLTTGKDNHTPDIVKLLGAFMAVQYITSSAYALAVLRQDWDPVAYSTGVGLILTALGASLRIKAVTEPDAG